MTNLSLELQVRFSLFLSVAFLFWRPRNAFILSVQLSDAQWTDGRGAAILQWVRIYLGREPLCQCLVPDD